MSICFLTFFQQIPELKNDTDIRNWFITILVLAIMFLVRWNLNKDKEEREDYLALIKSQKADLEKSELKYTELQKRYFEEKDIQINALNEKLYDSNCK